MHMQYFYEYRDTVRVYNSKSIFVDVSRMILVGAANPHMSHRDEAHLSRLGQPLHSEVYCFLCDV